MDSGDIWKTVQILTRLLRQKPADLDLLLILFFIRPYCLQNELNMRQFSNNVVYATSKASDQPVHMRCLIRAFAIRLIILWLFSYWLNNIWSF